jgi:uncharacterized membrane protein YkoI
MAAMLTLLIAESASATAGPLCSIHPPKHLTEVQLAALAKISLAAAEKTALARLNDPPGASISSAELEAEHGCLIWSFDVKLAGRPGVEEVQVDAGDGKVLSVEHESPRKESAESRS